MSDEPTPQPTLEDVIAGIDWTSEEQQLRERYGLDCDNDEALLQGAAYALMLRAWRNSPIEDAHARPRNNLHDGVMFARNTWVTHRAARALREVRDESNFPLRGLYRLESDLLSRDIMWEGTPGNLQTYGYGALSALPKHVKRCIDTSAFLYETIDSFRHYLVFTVLQAGWFLHRDHYGMPFWPETVERALVRLAAEDKDFIAQVDATSYLPDYSDFMAGAPEVYRMDLHRVRECLLHKPWELGAENLAWLAWNPVMMDGHP